MERTAGGATAPDRRAKNVAMPNPARNGHHGCSSPGRLEMEAEAVGKSGLSASDPALVATVPGPHSTRSCALAATAERRSCNSPRRAG